VTVSVRAANVAPVAVTDAYSVPAGSTLDVAASGGLLANDADADGDQLVVLLVSRPSHGTLRFNADGSFTYTADAGYTGADSFTYRAADGGATSGEATVTITVEPAATPDDTPPVSAPPARPPAPVVVANQPADAPAPEPTAPGTPDPGRESARPPLSFNPGGGGGGGGTPAAVPTVEAAPPAAVAPPAAAPEAPAAPAAPPENRAPAFAAPTSQRPWQGTFANSRLAEGMNTLVGDVKGPSKLWTYSEVGVSVGVVAGAGYVVLNARILGWVLSLVLARPLAWRGLDPLEVLYAWEKDKADRGDDEAETEESLESLVG
jgi:VCBS repeat-containing protein